MGVLASCVDSTPSDILPTPGPGEPGPGLVLPVRGNAFLKAERIEYFFFGEAPSLKPPGLPGCAMLLLRDTVRYLESQLNLQVPDATDDANLPLNSTIRLVIGLTRAHAGLSQFPFWQSVLQHRLVILKGQVHHHQASRFSSNGRYRRCVALEAEAASGIPFYVVLFLSQAIKPGVKAGSRTLSCLTAS